MRHPAGKSRNDGASERGPAARLAGARPGAVRVLCVDDEPRILEGLRLQLGRHCEVLTATSGAAGLEILRHEPNVAAIISDMRMPGMDGSTFLQQARELVPHTTRILLTGQADIGSAMAAINQGQVFRFLLKPCPPPLLFAAVAAAVGQYRLVSAQHVLMEQTTGRPGAPVDAQAALRTIFDRACELFACRYAAMARRADRDGSAPLLMTAGLAPELFAGAGERPAALAGLSRPGESVHLHATEERPRIEGLPSAHPAVREFLAVPIATATACYGWMYFADFGRTADFGADDVLAATTLASAAARVCEADRVRRHAHDAGAGHADVDHARSRDPLTGLENRREFLDRAAGVLQATAAGGGRVAMLVLDLERFKYLNDTLGHETCDEALKCVAERLRGLVTDGHIGRISGDRFAIAVPVDEDALALSRSRLCRPLEQPLVVAGHSLQLTARLGLSFFPQDGDTAEALLRHAEAAMKCAKATGERLCTYTPELGAAFAYRMKLEAAVRRAVEHEQFALYYQPKIDLRSGAICGAEALLRWDSAEFGTVSPSQFVPILEDSGLIVDVGRWVLRRAVADRRLWLDQGGTPPQISVNVSPLQLHRPGFVEELRDIVGGDPAVAAGISLEITESTLLTTADETIDTLRSVRDLGVAIAIDDFGTGYSALAYLARLPVSTVKIDRSFIVRLGDSADTAAVVAAIVSLAHSLKLRVVAEGVDTREQLEFLRMLHCDEFQGFLFSEALNPQDFATLLGQDRRVILD